MNISDLIERLEFELKEHGDHEVRLRTSDAFRAPCLVVGVVGSFEDFDSGECYTLIYSKEAAANL